MKVQEEDAPWLGNLINWWIFQIFGYIGGYYFGWIFVILGAPTWFYDFMTGLNLLPAGVTAWDTVMNA